MRIKRTFLWCFLLLIISSFLIGNVKARTEVFLLEPEKEATYSLQLTIHERVSGNVSVEGSVVDFYVTSPTRAVVFHYNQTANTNFNFTASENGNYTMHFVNSFSTTNVTIMMNYSILFVVKSQIGINFNAGATALATQQPSPLPKPRKPSLEDFFKKYLNFLEAEKILNIVRDASKYMPFGSFDAMIVLTLLVSLCYTIIRNLLNRFVRRKHFSIFKPKKPIRF